MTLKEKEVEKWKRVQHNLEVKKQREAEEMVKKIKKQ